MLARCKNPLTREEVIALEARIITAFDYEVAFPSTAYSLISQILGSLYA